MSGDLIHPAHDHEILSVSPSSMNWHHLGFRAHRLGPGEVLQLDTNGVETALVPMVGQMTVDAGDEHYQLSRSGVFEQAGSVLYLPPGTPARISTESGAELAFGTAPAVGVHPMRLIEPEDIVVEIRGGGNARRQVNHLLAPPLPAERLIVYEVYVPGGSWAGWPPHRHDGVSGSPYLEETYFFRFDRPDGFGFHRNYDAAAYDVTYTVHNDDCVAVPRGYHVTTTTPGNNMWILNFLAGELEGAARATPPYFDPATEWIRHDWSAGNLELPLVAPSDCH